MTLPFLHFFLPIHVMGVKLIKYLKDSGVIKNKEVASFQGVLLPLLVHCSLQFMSFPFHKFPP